MKENRSQRFKEIEIDEEKQEWKREMGCFWAVIVKRRKEISN
jgi:hypothetical protein